MTGTQHIEKALEFYKIAAEADVPGGDEALQKITDLFEKISKSYKQKFRAAETGVSNFVLLDKEIMRELNCNVRLSFRWSVALVDVIIMENKTSGSFFDMFF